MNTKFLPDEVYSAGAVSGDRHAHHDAFCQVLFSFYGRKIEDALPYTRPGKPFTLFLVRGQGYGDKAHRKAQQPPRG